MFNRYIQLTTALFALGHVVSAASKSCSTTTVTDSTPTNRPVALKEFSYCGGTLKTVAYIKNLCYNKIVKLQYSDARGKATPLTVIQLNYQSSIADNYELWGATTGYVNYDGVEKLLNLTFNAVDINEIYTVNLNRDVEPSGPKPTTSIPPAPYATPTGFSNDITDWLKPQTGSQAARSKRLMFANIEVTSAANGTIAAAQSYDNPNYGYHWVRDGSLTMDVVASLYSAATNKMVKTYEDLFFRYAEARAIEQLDPTAKTGLGEPKFNLDNTAFTGPWGRPQNDGPATAAITLMEFANAYLAKGGSKTKIRNYIYDSTKHPKRAPLQKDLKFVAKNWTHSSFDLWEEEESDHFYTRLVQRRAMILGSAFAKKMGDTSTATTLARQARNIEATLAQFWDARRGIILYAYGPVQRDKSLTRINDQILGTAFQIATSFIPVYEIAKTHEDSNGQVLGIPVGRYPEDVYDGVGTSEGNPWYLCTASLAELMYRASSEFTAAGGITVTKASRDFWAYFAPQVTTSVGSTYTKQSKEFKGMIASLRGWGDAFFRTIKYYTPARGHLSEEIDRDSGKPVGAIDLTWSYASVLTAAFARAEAMGDDDYLKTIANIPVKTNSTYI